jgi:tRNA-Thr(GGU) m(6)t(6)A37 methyltransferase TsaA
MSAPAKNFTVASIGHVESALLDRLSAPKQGHEGAPLSWLILSERVREAALDLHVGDELIVLTWLDRADREVLRVHPRDDLSMPQRGVFSTRSPDRPNPIGLHHVKIVAMPEALRIQVQDLEAIHMTPILDIKPVLKA